MRTLFLLLLTGFSVSLLSAQSVFTGTIKNESGEPLTTTITLQEKNSPVIAGFSRSNGQGEYSVSYEGKADSIKAFQL